MAELVVRSTAASAIAHLIERINATTGYPVNHDPNQNHDDCVTEYRSSGRARYKDQGHKPHDDNLVPAIIGWNRTSLRFPSAASGQKTAQFECVCPEVDANGDMTGNGIVWAGFRGECQIYFRLYATDVREVERFEALYMAKKLVSSITEQKLYINGRYRDDGSEDPLVLEPTDGVAPCMAVNFQYEWDFSDTSIQFTSDENTYITYEFSCILRGGFLAGTGNSDVITVNPDGSHTVGKVTYVLETRRATELVADVDTPR